MANDPRPAYPAIYESDNELYDFVKFVPVDWVLVSDLTVILVRVLDNFRTEHVIVDCRYHFTTKPETPTNFAFPSVTPSR